MTDEHCPYCVKVAGHRKAPGYGCAGLRVGVGVPIDQSPKLPEPGKEQEAARRVLVELMMTAGDERVRSSSAIAVLKGNLEQWTDEELLTELERRARALEKKP